jgi:small conductance mechanosensitive channel
MQAFLQNYQLSTVLEHAIRIGVILAGAYIAARVIEGVVPRIRMSLVERVTKRTGPDLELEKRAATLGWIFRRTAGAVVWVLAVVMVLRETGFDIGPILAGAGIVGLAVGFGAQNLVRDIISGMFLLIEDQVRVNDVAIINGTGGLVEQLNLRTTVLRGVDGTLHVFPNGAITTLSNMTHGYSYYVFDVGVAYKEDTDRVVAVLQEIANEMMQEEKYKPMILEPLEVLGVDKFADSAVIVKARVKTMPVQQWVVGREMNRRIKKKFDELSIEIPYPHRALSFVEGHTGKPGPQDFDREQLKGLIREVLEERSRPQS